MSREYVPKPKKPIDQFCTTTLEEELTKLSDFLQKHLAGRVETNALVDAIEVMQHELSEILRIELLKSNITTWVSATIFSPPAREKKGEEKTVEMDTLSSSGSIEAQEDKEHILERSHQPS